MLRPPPQSTPSDDPLPRLIGRGAFGGVLMGLANLVPGISGGTMLLASGIYPRFIEAIADLSRLRLRRQSLLVLGIVAAAAALAILLLAGPVKLLVRDQRWMMYSLFIGLTLGGLPVVWAMIKAPSRATWLGALAGFAGMALLAVAQASQSTTGNEAGWLRLLLAGTAGAAAMILPGVSGAYLLLVLGVYLPILDGIERFRAALSSGSLDALIGPLTGIVIPVGIGVVLGVVLVSNALKWLMARFEKATLGVLLGLLAGAVVGLWPFQRGRAPVVGETIGGRPVTPERLPELLDEPDAWPVEFFSPEPLQILGALALVALGFAATSLVARLGRD
jgi:putative membrane protein